MTNEQRKLIKDAKAANDWKFAGTLPARPGDKDKVIQVAPNGVRRIVSETGRVIGYR